MDSSRDADLTVLYERFNNPNSSRAVRMKYHQKFVNIQAQVKDRTLTKLRYELISASQHGTAEYADKIGQQIEEYSRKTKARGHR